MTGTQLQIEWAEQIKPRVGAEFDRVARVLAAVAVRQRELARSRTLAVIEIVNEKRAEVMANDEAGYFIAEWQELTDQVRKMICLDPRYQALRPGKHSTSIRTQQ